ncbi:FxSxx-COOH system tetratricopeptide repeat protein [Nonomuraea sp. NPDC003707]
MIRLDPGTLRDPSKITLDRGLWYLPRKPAAVFEGREQALTSLHQALEDDHARMAMCQVVYGLGGVGKSELALQYATTHRDRYQVVWWVTADNVERIQAGLAALAGRLHPPVRLVGKVEDAADWAIGWLQTHSDWLLILDNVDDPEHIRPLLGQLDSGHVLVTTRRDVRWGAGAQLMQLQVLDLEPAAELLHRITGVAWHRDTEHAAEELASELGYLPLALEQAAAYIAQTHISLVDYLNRLRRRPERMYMLGAEGSSGDRTIARLWTITMSTLGASDQGAVELLQILAHYAPDDIPRQIMSHDSLDNTDLDSFLGLLASYSLISLTDNSISIHRIMREVILAEPLYRDIQETARDTALMWLARSLPSDPEYNTDGWPLWRRLIPHIQALANSYPETGALFPLGDVLSLAGIFLRSQGSPVQAQPFAARALAIIEAAHGPNHSETASMLAHLANNCRALGRADEAVSLEERALAIAETAHGTDHPVVAALLDNLGRSLCALGRANESVPLQERALAVTERVYGPSHPDIADRLQNLATSFRMLGRVSEAVPLEERALAITEKAYGPNHPTVATRLGNLASSFHDLGRIREAVQLHSRALAIVKADYGPDHPVVATVMGNLAVSLCELERVDEALPLLQRALAISEEAYGQDHPDVVIRLATLARAFRDQDRLDEALTLELRALTTAEAIHGPDHPIVATLLSNMSVSFGKLGRARDAVPLIISAIKIIETAYGPEHPDIGTLLGNLAGCFRDLRRSKDAIPLEERALAITEAAYGPNHPAVAHRLGSLAVSLHATGRVDEAVPLEQRALAITKAVYGSDHPYVAFCLGSLAISLKDLGHLNQAVELYTQALAIAEAAYGPGHPATVALRQDMHRARQAL